MKKSIQSLVKAQMMINYLIMKNITKKINLKMMMMKNISSQSPLQARMPYHLIIK